MGTPRVFKSHENYNQIPKGGKYIYVMRNPEDVCVSFFHYLIKFVGMDEKNVTLDEFVQKLFLGSGSVSGNLWDHYLSFYEQRHHTDRVLFVFYEDLCSDLER